MIAVLYTGDIRMDLDLRKLLQNRLNPVRWERINVLQVPHHGAATAWLEPDMSQWRHRWSVFSFGLHNPHKHPRRKVVEAHAEKARVFVDEHLKFTIDALAMWR